MIKYPPITVQYPVVGVKFNDAGGSRARQLGAQSRVQDGLTLGAGVDERSGGAQVADMRVEEGDEPRETQDDERTGGAVLETVVLLV